MDEEQKQRWLDICAEAANCHEQRRLLELTREIISILSHEVQGLEDRPRRVRNAA
jgi:hypothetical protein